MSEQQELMSEEDKFFGVRTKIGGEREQEQEEASADQVDVDNDSADISDDELSGYSKRVQKRINKLRYESHEERRRAESAEQMRDEAYRVAQQMSEKNREYESLIGRGEQALIGQVKERAELSVNQAKEQYRKAYEEGDTDSVVNAQESLTKATAELTEAGRYQQNFSGQQAQQQQYEEQYRAQQQQQAQQQQYQAQQPQQQNAVRPDPETEEWASENPWFMEDGYEEMTSLAYGKHASLVKQGVKPNSREYFRQIDETVRRAFPDHDWQVGNTRQERTSTAGQPSMVVAPSSRNNGAKPRTVKLSPTQRTLAKKLGLTEQQYAKYV